MSSPLGLSRRTVYEESKDRYKLPESWNTTGASLCCKEDMLEIMRFVVDLPTTSAAVHATISVGTKVL